MLVKRLITTTLVYNTASNHRVGTIYPNLTTLMDSHVAELSHNVNEVLNAVSLQYFDTGNLDGFDREAGNRWYDFN